MVMCKMLRLRSKQLKVGNVVVCFVLIDMVDDFFARKNPINAPLHHKTMLSNQTMTSSVPMVRVVLKNVASTGFLGITTPIPKSSGV
jgi:hypothetical protein